MKIHPYSNFPENSAFLFEEGVSQLLLCTAFSAKFYHWLSMGSDSLVGMGWTGYLMRLDGFACRVGSPPPPIGLGFEVVCVLGRELRWNQARAFGSRLSWGDTSLTVNPGCGGVG